MRTLRTPAEFRRVLQGGRRFVQGRVVLYVVPASDVLPPAAGDAADAAGADGVAGSRVGFVTGRRIGGAVVRNRARRLLRAAWRALAPSLATGTEAVLAVLVARPEIREAKGTEVADDVRAALARAGAIAS